MLYSTHASPVRYEMHRHCGGGFRVDQGTDHPQPNIESHKFVISQIHRFLKVPIDIRALLWFCSRAPTFLSIPMPSQPERPQPISTMSHVPITTQAFMSREESINPFPPSLAQFSRLWVKLWPSSLISTRPNVSFNRFHLSTGVTPSGFLPARFAANQTLQPHGRQRALEPCTLLEMIPNRLAPVEMTLVAIEVY